ncbi:MAG TPA: ABC transporter permease [Bryobacteraceae bacterium]
MNSIRPLEMILQDVRYGLRQLRNSPGFAATAILSLALGVGANTAIFQLLNAVRLRSLPVERPQELASIKLAGGNSGLGVGVGWGDDVTFPLWEQIRDNQQAFSSTFAFATNEIGLGTRAQRTTANALFVTGQAFSTLGVTAYRGRMLAPDDDRHGCGAGSAVISHSFWQRQFAGRDDAIGSSLILGDHAFTIAGVTPPSFFGMEVGKTFDVAVPVCTMPLFGYQLDRRDLWALAVAGRLKLGWTIARAADHLKTISPGLFEAAAPAGYNARSMKIWYSFRLTAEPGGNGISRLRRDYESSLWLLLGITGLVLLIACANLANLLLARAGTREREMAVRLSIGASRGRLVGQLFSESLILAVIGGALGAGVALFLSELLIRFISTKDDIFELNLNADWRMLAFTIAVALATCIVFGLAPALRSTRVDASAAMKSGGRGATADRRRFGFQQVLIASQVAISFVLVTGALLFVTSFRKLTTLDTGFKQEGLITSFVDFDRLSVPNEKLLAYQDNLLAKVRSIPGIQSASTSTHTPMDGSSWTLGVRVPGFEGKGKDWSKFTWVRPHYFETLDLRLLAGRDINDFDTANSRKVVIVNETFARQVFGTSNPIGRAVISLAEPGYPEMAHEIIGVVRNANYGGLREKIPPESYAPASQNPRIGSWVAIVTRSVLPPDQVVSSIQRAIAAVNPAIAVRSQVVRQVVEDGLVRERTLAWLSGFFGGLAALLAMIGLYGVISYMVARRQSEIGIRLALGAGPEGILGLILRQVALLVTLGLIAGAALSLVASRGAANLLFGLTPHDPTTLVIGAAGLAAVAFAASFIPALRAAKVDPMVALRQE